MTCVTDSIAKERPLCKFTQLHFSTNTTASSRCRAVTPIIRPLLSIVSGESPSHRPPPKNLSMEMLGIRTSGFLHVLPCWAVAKHIHLVSKQHLFMYLFHQFLPSRLLAEKRHVNKFLCWVRVSPQSGLFVWLLAATLWQGSYATSDMLLKQEIGAIEPSTFCLARISNLYPVLAWWIQVSYAWIPAHGWCEINNC